MFLAKSQLVLVVATLMAVASVNCAKWRPRPPRYSSESFSNSRSVGSSEEYYGSLPPLQLSGVDLPLPSNHIVNHNTVPIQSEKPYSSSFATLIKGSLPEINQAAGSNRKLAYVTKVRQIPTINAGEEMYFVKGNFITTDTGSRSKCSFYLYSNGSVKKVMQPYCYY